MLKWLNGDVSDRGAKSACDYLIVALQNDPNIDRPSKNKPVQSIFERQLQLSAVRFIDDIVVYNTEDELLDILKTLPITVRIIGSDYIGKDFTGKQYCVDHDIDIVYNTRSHSFSTSSLRERVIHSERTSN
jgi:glycerol-3-phosphate cytidylyltransferase